MRALIFACLFTALGLFAGLGLPAASAQADTLSGVALANALRQGGYVLVMRHANATEANAEADNPQHERQLDANGKAQTQTIGAALKAAHIPVGAVFSTPTYRARETVTYAGLPAPQALEQLGDGGAPGMTKASPDAAAFLKAKAAEPPMRGTNTVIVSHQPNIIGAFPEAEGIVPDEILVLKPDGKGGDAVIARVKPDDWQVM